MAVYLSERVSKFALMAFTAATLSACIGGGDNSSSSISSSSSSTSSASLSSSSNSSISSSSSSISSSSSSSDVVATSGNHYDAHRAPSEPIIDGDIDSAWAATGWHAIDVAWRGDGSGENWVPPSSPEDFTGRYKAMWDSRQLYLLVDITDDILHDNSPDPFSSYHLDDTVEIFLDEDNSRENFVGSVSAYAYHVSILKDVIDKNKLLNDHVTVEIKNIGNNRYIWEMSIRIYDKDFNLWSDANTNVAVELKAGKTMGFTASYIDNDGGSKRESFIGSVDSPGHQSNKGYQDSSAFGTMTLVD